MQTYSKSSTKVNRDSPEGNEATQEIEIPYWQKVAIGNDLVVDGPVTFGISNDYEQHEVCDKVLSLQNKDDRKRRNFMSLISSIRTLLSDWIRI